MFFAVQTDLVALRGDPPQRRGILRHAVSADKKRRLDIPCRQTVEQTLVRAPLGPSSNVSATHFSSSAARTGAAKINNASNIDQIRRISSLPSAIVWAKSRANI